MTLDQIKELIQVFNESGVAEMEVQRGEDRLRLRRASVHQDLLIAPAGHPAAPVTAGAEAPAGHPAISSYATSTATATAKAPEPDSGHVLVKSPIVGTYYDAPRPARRRSSRWAIRWSPARCCASSNR